MIIRHNIFLMVLLLAGLALTSCQIDEMIDNTPSMSAYDDSNLIEAGIRVVVNELNVDVGTRAEEPSAYNEPATDAEKEVSDLWVFQYDTNGDLLIQPRYYTVSDQSELEHLTVWLRDSVESYIYVVTNTLDEVWITDRESVGTIELLKKQILPDPFPIIFDGGTEDNPIPMEGMTEGTVIPNETDVITVPVTRMYAKVKVKVVFGEILKEFYSDVEVNYIDFRNIPEYCRVGTLASEQTDITKPVTFPNGIDFVSRAMNKPDEEGDDADEDYYPYVIYVPETLCGEGSNTKNTPSKKVDEAPENAMNVRVRINYRELEGSQNSGTSTGIYTVYPGGNDYNNYNIRRNSVYRLTINIGYPLEDTINGSANTFVGMEGDLISFYPYFREEHGGGYDISAYLDSTDPDKTIDRVEIIWQYKDCIGDNSKGDLVWLEYDEEETDPTLNCKVYVQTNKEGNALIGAYNSEGTIIWSWLIWVRDPQYGDPTNLGNALLYYTYDWDENGIKTDSPRISGYPIMSCNIGALQDEPEYDANIYFGHHHYGTTDKNYDSKYAVQTFQDGDCITRTFGLLFQWGRKDPFPPMTKTDGASGNSSIGLNTGYYVHDYDDSHTSAQYANDNTTVVHKTSYGEKGPNYTGSTNYGEGEYLFYTHLAESNEGVQYSINHPTVFLCGTKDIAQSLTDAYTSQKADALDYIKDDANYAFSGAWSGENHDNQEWGAGEVDSNTMQYYTGLLTDAGTYVTLYDNFGGEKSIFDPCPYGWRVAPGELWLGFTKNGLNALDDPLDQNKYYEGGASDDDGSLDNINYDPEKSCMLGMSLYLGPTWRTGLTSWFPCQGFRFPDGTGFRVGCCGNYANANADAEPDASYDRINVIHIHDRVTEFKAYERSFPYTVKASANSIRCVRDTK